jgi:hypothetical protein
MRTSAYTGVKQQGKKPSENMKETLTRPGSSQPPTPQTPFFKYTNSRKEKSTEFSQTFSCYPYQQGRDGLLSAPSFFVDSKGILGLIIREKQSFMKRAK